MDGIITRIWHGTVKKKDANKYKKYIEDTGLKKYREIEGKITQ